MGLVATQQILLPITSMKMSLIISERKIDILILVTSIQLIIEKMVYKNVKQYEHIERLSAVISDAWDRLTKNPSIIQSTNDRCD